LTNAEPALLSLEEAARAILSRWGASENTFKHLQERHPLHYQPGFKLVESERQEIANPELKALQKLIGRLRKDLDKLYKKLTKTPERTNQDGTPRRNSQHQRLQAAITRKEQELKGLQEDKSRLAEKVDVSTLENYRSFKQVDNEGKYLFDFVTAGVWNARKQMVDWLRAYYDRENDLVDLFYTITHCPGWVRTTADTVTVRLEPLQQPKRRVAQEHLCRKLTALGAQTPLGKRLIVEVGESPLR
jgi:Skp family chaperone for outer membrane proteins